MNKEEVENIIKETIQYANEEIKKSKKKTLKILLIILIVIFLLVMSIALIFKYEIPVKYNKDIVDISIPTDKGIDIKINLNNYKNTNAVLVKVDENNYDLYMNITQTLATKIFKDNDKSNNLLRVGNSMIVDFQSGKLQEYIPNGNNEEVIQHIYYIDNLSKKIKTMDDNELIKYENKVLIWENDKNI